jgi:hypothetical protein
VPVATQRSHDTDHSFDARPAWIDNCGLSSGWDGSGEVGLLAGAVLSATCAQDRRRLQELLSCVDLLAPTASCPHNE